MKVLYMETSKTTIIFFVAGIITNLCVPAFGAGYSLDNQSKINIGFSAGPNLTHIARKFEDGPWIIDQGYSTEAKPALSYAAGLFFQYNFSKSSSVRTEILYNRKGLHDQYIMLSTQNIEGIYHVYFERLIIPLYYRARLGKLFIDAGVFAGYAIRGVTVLRNHKQPDLPDPHKTSFTAEKPFFKGLSAGIGYNFLDNKSYSLSVELRDEYEMTNRKSFNHINFLSLNTVNLLAGIAIKL